MSTIGGNLIDIGRKVVTTTDPSAASTVAAAAMPRRSLWQRVPWLWSDFVARLPVPLWVPSVLIFLFLYGMGVIFAMLDGELRKFLLDIRWLFPTGMPAFGSFALGYAPRALDRLWASLKPWLAGSEEEHSTFWAATHNAMVRLFLGIALLIGGIFIAYSFVPGVDNFSPDYAHPEIIHNIWLFATPFEAYFGGGAVGLVGFGLVLFTRRMSRYLKLRREFILEGGKAILQPLRQLLWVVWGTLALPIIVGTGIITNPISGGEIRIWEISAWVINTALFLPMVLVPQEFVSQLLAKQKAEDLRALRQELAEVASPPEGVDAVEIQRRALHHQHLVFQIQQVQSFNPTLVDARFAIQIATSVTAILLATILIRTLLPQ